MLFSQFCQLRRLVFDQSSPVHPDSLSRGGYYERDGGEGRTEEILVSNIGFTMLQFIRIYNFFFYCMRREILSGRKATITKEASATILIVLVSLGSISLPVFSRYLTYFRRRFCLDCSGSSATHSPSWKVWMYFCSVISKEGWPLFLVH